jgi:hypothetical protein
VPASRKRKKTKKQESRTRPRQQRPDENPEDRLEAIERRAWELEQHQTRPGQFHNVPTDPVKVEEEFNQQKRLQALIKHGIEWAADWPYHESGHNSRGRQDYIMMVEAADGDWASTHMVDGEQKRWLTIATESSWEALVAAVEREAAKGPWWARKPGARQWVYEHAARWRRYTGADEEDCHDAGLGAADYPFLNEYYFIGWIRANPREVADSEIAMLVLDNMDEGLESEGEGAALKLILQEMLALPAPIEPPSRRVGDGEDDKEAES